jgi:hypothetical protein
VSPPAYNGLIQHSFAMRLPKGRRQVPGGNRRQLEKLFALPAQGGAEFKVNAVGKPAAEDGSDRTPTATHVAEHTPLVRHRLTTVEPLPISFSGATGDKSGCSNPRLPRAFGWAAAGKALPVSTEDGPTFVFAGLDAASGEVECNDYLVERTGCGGEEPLTISRALLEILAHKRSRLLGLALANRIVSVMLPHAILQPVAGGGSSGDADRAWFVQPLLSFTRDGQVKTAFRDSYSLTLLLVPVRGHDCREREVTEKEIDWAVNAGWALAAVPTRKHPPRFRARGPLLDYLRRLVEPYDAATLLWPPDADPASRAGAQPPPITLRQGTEVLTFCLGLKLAEATGPRDGAARRRIGDEVVTSLGSARVSSVLVVDGANADRDDDGRRKKLLERHHDLMTKIARETRPPSEPGGYEKYRLDRDFVDDDTYVVGLVPTRRCIVVSCDPRAQHGWYQSGLMQAGSLTHMTIGAATALGTLCAIDRDLEDLEVADPGKIADIDGEIAVDFREIYDLDITDEAYRRLYRLLRKRLGIIRDYEALEEKMMALYRATSTKHSIEAQKQLEKLTRVILVLTLLVLVVGVLAIIFE